MIHDPIVIEPAGFDQKKAWDECSGHVEQCGGLSHDDGSPNWRAAFGADPGLVGCPCCHRSHWNWGSVQKCTGCGFVYPTDWWPMFSWGTQDGRGSVMFRRSPRRERYLSHAYYRYGVEHPADAENLYGYAHTLPWRELVGDWDTRAAAAKERG